MFERIESALSDGSRAAVVINGESGGVRPATLDFASRTWTLDGDDGISPEVFPVNVLAPRPNGDVLVELRADGTFGEV